jgi:hypothetical protein
MTCCLEDVFAEVVSRTEWSLGLGLGNPRLRLLPAAMIGGLACAVADEISLAREALLLPYSRLRKVLAHEAVHVAQKRLRRPSRVREAATSRHVQRVEQEADRASDAILQGVRSRCTVADAARRVAFWGEVGHYYTTYYVMLMAGVPADAAYTRAFFCQLPDEVLEFDAVAATQDHRFAAPMETDAYPTGQYLVSRALGERATPNVDCSKKPGPCNDESAGYYYTTRQELRLTGPRRESVALMDVVGEDPGTKSRRLRRNIDVIQGLHCLTGGSNSDQETRLRGNRVIDNWNDLIASGLALHAFGDSFAHRDLKDATHLYQGSTVEKSHLGHGFDFHDPDYVSTHASEYKKYCEALYDLVCKCQGSGGATQADRGSTLQALGTLTSYTRVYITGDDFDVPIEVPWKGKDAEGQATTDIKNLIESKLRASMAYAPETQEAVYWETFAGNHQAFFNTFGGEKKVKKRIIECAALWGKGAADATKAVAKP